MNFRKHDWRERRFAILITETGFEEVHVTFRRYWCKDCDKPVQADISGLYYDECHYGRPIVDLCLYLATDNTFNAVERHLQHLGLQVDKDTVQRYVENFGDELADQHGVTIADASVSINFLDFLFDEDSVEEFRREYAEELADEEADGIVGVADETYPTKKGAKKALYEENMRRKQAGEEKRRLAESFTLGAGYLWPLGCFASIQCRETAFARGLAMALVTPFEGVDYWLTDDNAAYNDILPDRIKCLVHKLRTRLRNDETVEQLHEDGEIEALQEYLEDEYEQLYTDLIAELKETHPEFWDAEREEFTAPVSTNAIEGGNWRLKYALRTPYYRCQAVRGRTALIALRDSRQVFSNGRPAESLAHRHSSADFAKVLGEGHSPIASQTEPPPQPATAAGSLPAM